MQRGGASGGAAGSGGSQRADWTDAARRAQTRAAAGPGGVKIKCPGNLVLYYFLL
jgi:hypothetical protein